MQRYIVSPAIVANSRLAGTSVRVTAAKYKDSILARALTTIPLLVLPLLLISCSSDSSGTAPPPPPPSAGTLSGTLQLGAPRAAVVVAFAPRNAVDSVLIGNAKGSPGAYLVTSIRNDRVMVYSDTNLALSSRMRVFLHPGASASSVRATVVEQSTADGTTDSGAGSSVSLLP